MVRKYHCYMFARMVGKSKYKLLVRYTIYSSIRMINALKKDIRGISCFSSK